MGSKLYRRFRDGTQRRFRAASASAQSDHIFTGMFWRAKGASFVYAENEDWSDCVDEQADLSSFSVHVSRYVFSHCGTYHITKTCLYNFDPLKPYFYIAELGFTGVYIIFLFLLKNTDCGTR